MNKKNLTASDERKKVRVEYERRVAEILSEAQRAYDEGMEAYKAVSDPFDAVMFEWHRKAFKLPKGATREDIVAAGRKMFPAERRAITEKWKRTKVYKEWKPNLDEAWAKVPQKPDARMETDIRYMLIIEEFRVLDSYSDSELLF